MSFLAPIYLALLSAIAVPLLLHLMRRRIGRRVEFPATRYIVRAERENSRRLRLRNLLLMALRIAIVLLLALAAARPVGRLLGAGHVPTALAIVLDNSSSTSVVVNGSPLFASLRTAAIEAARGASGNDRVWLITADGRVVGGSTSSVIDAVAATEPMAGRGDLPAAVARAVGVVRSSGLTGQHVAVATDGQLTSWTRRSPVGEVRITIMMPAGSPPLNRAVTLAEARPVRWTPRGAVVARTAAPDSVTWRISLGGRTLARGTAAPGEEILVRASPAERGWVPGTVELEPDELRADDVRHFVAWVGPAPTVSVHEGAGPFVRSAVDALVQSERLRTGGGVAIVPADHVTSLPALILAPSDPVRVGAANRALERAGVPWRLGAVRRGDATVREPAGRERLLDGATVTRSYVLSTAGAATGDTLARLGAAPWVVAGEGYVLVASPFEPEATNLPVRAGFLPWIVESVSQHLAGGAGAVIAAAPTAMTRLPANITAIEDPLGQRTSVVARDITAPARPGVYFLLAGDERDGALVVNGEADESLLQRLGASSLRDRFSGPYVRTFDEADSFARAAFEGDASRPLMVPLLALAVIALVAEAIAARGARRVGTGARAAA